MIKFHDIEQGSDEWLELRKDYRTASEASAVMGLSPFQKPEDMKLVKAMHKRGWNLTITWDLNEWPIV